jgi:hypothetical protein
MFRSQPHLTRLFLPLALVGFHLFAGEASAQKAQKAQEALNYAPPTVSLSADQDLINACEGDPAAVRLTAQAFSPSGSPIRYRWAVSNGSIDGEGPTVTWNLSGVRPGQYKAYLVVNSASGDEACEAYANTLVAIRCNPKPTCPNVNIVCPEHVMAGQPVTFTSTLTGGTGNVPQIYHWTVSAGRIIGGQGTNTIKVDTSGLEGQSLKASLSMAGYEEDCSASCTIEFPVPITCRKFDEFPDISRNDEKARLDNFAIELQNDPTSTAYVIVHPASNGRSGTAQARATRIVDYVVNSRQFDARRIVTLIGPARSELAVELRICPQGAPAPTP